MASGGSHSGTPCRQEGINLVDLEGNATSSNGADVAVIQVSPRPALDKGIVDNSTPLDGDKLVHDNVRVADLMHQEAATKDNLAAPNTPPFVGFTGQVSNPNVAYDLIIVGRLWADVEESETE